jgi:hypothetical protein
VPVSAAGARATARTIAASSIGVGGSCLAADNPWLLMSIKLANNNFLDIVIPFLNYFTIE